MKTRTSIFLAVLLTLGGCEVFVTGINQDDITRAQNAELKLVVTAAELHFMGVLEADLARVSGMWSGYFTGLALQAASYHSYNVTSTTSSGWWNSIYAGALKNIRIAQQKAILYDNPTQLGVCQVMEASLLGTAAALWGDVPYSQAINVDQFPDPVYDSQIEVIDQLIVLLDTAIVKLQLDPTSSRDGDFLFGTNPVSQWVAVANSAKARLLLYRKDYTNALIAANSGIVTTDLMAKHGTNFGERNLFYSFQMDNRPTNMGASNAWLGKLLNASTSASRNHAKTNESARLARYYSGASPSTYNLNTGSGGFFSLAAPFPLHTASETRLIAAECYLRTADFANALIKLNQHRASLRTTYPTGIYTDFAASDFDAGGIENLAGTLTPDGALLREILEEKYVSLFGQIEAFNEIRRTGNALSVPANIGLQIPQRLPYALTEINANRNVPTPQPSLFEKTELFE